MWSAKAPISMPQCSLCVSQYVRGWKGQWQQTVPKQKDCIHKINAVRHYLVASSSDNNSISMASCRKLTCVCQRRINGFGTVGMFRCGNKSLLLILSCTYLRTHGLWNSHTTAALSQSTIECFVTSNTLTCQIISWDKGNWPSKVVGHTFNHKIYPFILQNVCTSDITHNYSECVYTDHTCATYTLIDANLFQLFYVLHEWLQDLVYSIFCHILRLY